MAGPRSSDPDDEFSEDEGQPTQMFGRKMSEYFSSMVDPAEVAPSQRPPSVAPGAPAELPLDELIGAELIASGTILPPSGAVSSSAVRPPPAALPSGAQPRGPTPAMAPPPASTRPHIVIPPSSPLPLEVSRRPRWAPALLVLLALASVGALAAALWLRR